MTTCKLEIRDQIIACARNIFNRFGFRKTTMDEIAQSMGKGKSSIYYYFKSKEEIYEAVIEREAEFLRQEVTKAISQVDDPAEKLKIYVITRMKTFRKVTNYYDAIRSEVVSHLEVINRIRDKYDREEVRLLQNIIEEGVAKKVFHMKDPELASIAIVTALKGLEVPMFWSNKRKDAENNLEELLNVLFYGIMRP
jgi:AcrR family transcriptional regulator